MGSKIKEETRFYFDSIAKSYAQVFFSDNIVLALLVILASFIDPFAGLAGILCVITTVILAKGFGLNEQLIRNGTYGFNAVLAGLALGVFFKFTLTFCVLLLLASILLLLLTVWLSGVSTAYRVPFLSIPFVVCIWVLVLSGRTLDALHLREREINSYAELWQFGGAAVASFFDSINKLDLPMVVGAYLKSLGSVVFESNIVAGLLVALALLIFSRIAFTLSIIGFAAGYAFTYFFRGDVNMIEYSFIGFNYILSAIAIGGFFLIPSAGSYIIAIVMVPVVGLLITAINNVVAIYHLPIYSMPFSIAVILVVYALVNRYSIKKLALVQYQQFSPEKNLYTLKNKIERFKNDTYFHIGLPFYGEWLVSQGHNGNITHKDDWRFAWDFVVTDENNRTFKLPGREVTDFYCYGLPVIAPAAGYVVKIVDGIEDNPVGDANIADNWGNTIIIKHGDYLYSQISHIKKESFKVRLGDYVRKGDVLALCGNSGRAPEPHIHFQLQSVPEVGAKTLQYPICYYQAKEDGKYSFQSFTYPKQGQLLSKVIPTALLQSAFHFPLGKTFEFKVKGKKEEYVKWEVFVDMANNPYIYCWNTGSYAYFTNNETLYYFTDFKGDSKSLLYYFYVGAHKILLGYSGNFEVKDSLNAQGFVGGPAKFIQDFVAPFTIFMHSEFTARYTEIENQDGTKDIKIMTNAIGTTGSMVNRKIDFEMMLCDNKLKTFTINENNQCIIAEHLN